MRGGGIRAFFLYLSLSVSLTVCVSRPQLRPAAQSETLSPRASARCPIAAQLRGKPCLPEGLARRQDGRCCRFPSPATTTPRTAIRGRYSLCRINCKCSIISFHSSIRTDRKRFLFTSVFPYLTFECSALDLLCVCVFSGQSEGPWISVRHSSSLSGRDDSISQSNAGLLYLGKTFQH